ncbi:MAG: fimbrial protein [Morganella sp. (in: enterobacteria)]
MKLKNILLVSSAAAVMSLSSFAYAGPLSDTANIKFSGSFQDETCAITVDGYDAENATANVLLGSHKGSDMADVASVTPAVKFSMNFAACGGISVAQVKFVGGQSTAGVFDVTDKNKSIVGIGLSKTADAGNYFQTGSVVDRVDIKDGSAVQDYFARFVKLSDADIEEGNTSATVQVDVTYG